MVKLGKRRQEKGRQGEYDDLRKLDDRFLPHYATSRDALEHLIGPFLRMYG